MPLNIITNYTKSEYEKELERAIDSNLSSISAGITGKTISSRQFNITADNTSSFLISISGFNNTLSTLHVYWNSALLYEDVHFSVSANVTVVLLNNFKMMNGDEILLVSYNNTK